MAVAEHDLNHAVDLHVAAVHRTQQGLDPRLLDDVVYLAARLEDLDALVFLGIE